MAFYAVRIMGDESRFQRYFFGTPLPVAAAP
jgi:hypothetical protein